MNRTEKISEIKTELATALLAKNAILDIVKEKHKAEIARIEEEIAEIELRIEAISKVK